MAHFTIAAQKVNDLQDPTVVMALHKKLRGSQYATSKVSRIVKMLAKAMVRTQEEMRVENMYRGSQNGNPT